MPVGAGLDHQNQSSFSTIKLCFYWAAALPNRKNIKSPKASVLLHSLPDNDQQKTNRIVCVYVCTCVCACVRACVRVCVLSGPV